MLEKPALIIQTVTEFFWLCKIKIELFYSILRHQKQKYQINSKFFIDGSCMIYVKHLFLQPVSVKRNIVQWCNGSTADFGSACLGSNPGWTTVKPGTLG